MIGRSARVAKEHGQGLSNARRGRAWLLAVGLALVVGLSFLWFGGQTLRGPRSSGPQADPPTPRVPAPHAAAAREPARPGQEELAPAESELEPLREVQGSPVAGGPRGSLRGRLEVQGEEPLPDTWRLIARPSRFLPERETAVERRLEFTDGRREFVLPDLPLGGYDVQAEAEGFNGQVLPLLLERGGEHPFVVLHLVPAGTLEGRVVDSEKAPAEGIPISLFDQQSGAAREAVTDARGVFRFEKLPDGAYDLLIGKDTAPLVRERRPVRFSAPRLTFPEIELPPLGTIDLRVVDSLSRPLEGVEVRGSGTNGGLVDGRTDFEGRIVARHLPAGHFRLRLEHPALDSAYSRRITLEVNAGAVAEARVPLGP
jgi:hypothetical protein